MNDKYQKNFWDGTSRPMTGVERVTKSRRQAAEKKKTIDDRERATLTRTTEFKEGLVNHKRILELTKGNAVNTITEGHRWQSEQDNDLLPRLRRHELNIEAEGDK